MSALTSAASCRLQRRRVSGGSTGSIIAQASLRSRSSSSRWVNRWHSGGVRVRERIRISARTMSDPPRRANDSAREWRLMLFSMRTTRHSRNSRGNRRVSSPAGARDFADPWTQFLDSRARTRGGTAARIARRRRVDRLAGGEANALRQYWFIRCRRSTQGRHRLADSREQ